MAMELAPNGITVRATQPKPFYEGNQRHILNGKEYYVVLSREELLSLLFQSGDEVPDASHIVTTFVRDMDLVFHGEDDFNDDISGWDTSNVVTMSLMFCRARSFNQDISAWDTSNVDHMDNMFSQAWSFDQDLSKWNIRSVQSMDYMFWDASSFTYDVETAWKSTKMAGCDTASWMRGTQYEYNKQRKELASKTVSAIKDELMATAWEPSRVIDWCFDEDAKESMG